MAIIARPYPLVSVVANQRSSAPASNAGKDVPGLVWRSADLNTVFATFDLGESREVDVIALIGTNLRANDTVAVRFGSEVDGSGIITASTGTTTSRAFDGEVPDGSKAKAIIKLDAAFTGRYVRIEITSNDNPDGYVEVQRVVLGKALGLTGLAGVDMSAEQTFVDQSVAYSGDGYTTFDDYPTLMQWNVTISFIEDSDWRNSWFGFMQRVGKSRAFLFVPDSDHPEQWQTEAVFGRIVTDAKATVQGFGIRKCELTVRSISQ